MKISSFPYSRNRQDIHPLPLNTGQLLSAGKQEANKKALEFEAIFISSGIKTMFSGMDTDGPFGGGFGEEIFREFLADEYAKEIVRSGGVGVSEQIRRELLSIQEVK
ncbi:MAG: rod-binding protein [Alphaproteobacteria bacterium]|nr:rod-binding protein [Alphaproteobacteria bacterium]